MRWIDLTPYDFRKGVKDCGLCVLPVGSLERHGEHGYLGTDGVIAETLANKAAEIDGSWVSLEIKSLAEHELIVIE